MKRIPLNGALIVALSAFAFSQVSYTSVNGAIAKATGEFTGGSEPARAPQAPGPSLVSIIGRQMIVRRRNPNGTLAPAAPYIIRGVDWSPARTDTTSALSVRRLAFEQWASTDIPMIANMNANTVFTYLDPNLNANGMGVLDQLYNAGIMVVMTVDEGTNNTTQVQQAVDFFKNHPAILAWNVGVEWNITLYFTNPPISIQEAANRTQTAAALIKSLDANHPVLTSYGDINIEDAGRRLGDTKNYVNNVCTSVDGWALNIFRNSDFGTLFDQWKAISSKPMLLGEFGTDAFRTYNPDVPAGSVDENMQAQWDLAEWNHLAKNLSANHPGKAAVGGFIFEWNDEWWKVPNTDGQHDPGGGNGSVCGGHPDNFCNEEYFGIVALDPGNATRLPRAVYDTMMQAFAAGYQPPANPKQIFRASSRGQSGGFARFIKGNNLFYDHAGGGGGGRGFNVVVINPCTGEQVSLPQNYDTYNTRDSGTDMTALTSFLSGLPNGVLVMLSVGDEAGLTDFSSCMHLNPQTHPWIEPFYQVIEALGSAQIRHYCFTDSWAMIAFKGNPASKVEDWKTGLEASVQFILPLQSSLSPASRSFSASPASGTISVSVPSGCNWTAVSNDSFITINSGSSGIGNGIVTYSVAANAAPVRTGTITAGGQLFTVMQSEPGGSGGRTPVDLDADRKTELAYYRGGLWGILKSSQAYALGSARFFSWGGAGLPPIVADFDGDGQVDLCYIVPPSGGQSATYSILKSSTNYDFAAGQVLFVPAGFPVLGDTTVVGDFDGDGKADPAIWRSSQGVWIMPLSSANYASFVFAQWGQSGDVPIVADFDGDGKADIGFYRAGLWGVLKSSQGYSLASAQFFSWGGVGLAPIVADFDGDGKADLGYVAPPAGGQSAVYSILQSSTGYSFGAGQVLFVPAGFPVLGDTPVVGDFDGDGKADPGIWRSSQGVWIIPRSSANYTSFIFSQWGQAGDVPMPGNLAQN
jgi:hypothetical protein